MSRSIERGARLGLCMIARDEEALLPGCLASVAGVVDEMALVDTGSTDRTVALARGAGARVIERAWTGDFSAARNAALAESRADYVLVLDADERLAGGARKLLREVVQKARIDCGLLPLHHADALAASEGEVLSGRRRIGEPMLLPRLLRRTPELAWQGIVHESPSAWLAQPGRRVCALEAPIVHYGAIPALRESRGKNRRNMELLERRCAEHPHDANARAYLALECARAGQRERARVEAERALLELESLRASGSQQGEPVQIATLLAHQQLQAGEPEAARETVARARALRAEHPNLELLDGLACELLALRSPAGPLRAQWCERASTCFEACAARAGRAFAAELLPGATSWAALAHLGAVRLLARDAVGARRAAEAALAFRADHRGAQLTRAEALLELGELAVALESIAPLLPQGGPDAWLLAAACALGLGQVEDARLFMQRVRAERGRRDFAAPLRAERYGELERALASAA